jgi:hypothetical protein
LVEGLSRNAHDIIHETDRIAQVVLCDRGGTNAISRCSEYSGYAIAG